MMSIRDSHKRSPRLVAAPVGSGGRLQAATFGFLPNISSRRSIATFSFATSNLGIGFSFDVIQRCLCPALTQSTQYTLGNLSLTGHCNANGVFGFNHVICSL